MQAVDSVSGRAKPCHGIDRRVGVGTLLLLASVACDRQRPSASSAATAGSPGPAASAAAAPDDSGLHLASVRLISELRSPLWLDLYVSRNVKEIEAVARDAESLLRGYERAGKGRVKLAVHEVGQDTAEEAAREAGMLAAMRPQPLEQLGFLGLTLRYADQRTLIPLFPLDGSSGFEFWITNKIREMRDLGEHRQHRIGVMTGKAELKLSDPVLAPRGGKDPTLANIMKQAFPFYALVPVDLQGGKAAIDAGLDGLIITQPGQDYELAELQRIDQFLLLGNKSVAVFASAVNLPPGSPQMRATLDTHGLEKLLRGYGVELDSNVLWDHGSSFKVQVLKDDGERATFRYPPIPIVSNESSTPTKGPLDSSAVPFFRLDTLAFPYASSLRLTPDKQPADVKLRGIARSSDDTTSTQASPVDLRPAPSYPRGEMRSHLLAVTVQGRLCSAFPLPLGDGKLGPVSPAPSRLLVIASSTYLANPFVYADNATTPDPMVGGLAQPYLSNLTPTIISLKNTLDWMLADDDFVELSATIVPRSP